jgi:hypothetical protein
MIDMGSRDRGKKYDIILISQTETCRIMSLLQFDNCIMKYWLMQIIGKHGLATGVLF